MSKHDFECCHERHPLFVAASRFFSAVRKLSTQHGGGALRSQLEREATRMAGCIAEAIDVEEVRTKQLARAVLYRSKATSTLGLMYTGELVEEAAYRRVLHALRVVSLKLDLARRAPVVSEPVSDEQVAAAEPGTEANVGGEERERPQRDDDDLSSETPPAGEPTVGKPPLDS